jgi:hypothetical protein
VWRGKGPTVPPLNTVMNLRVQQKAGNIFTTFSRTLLHRGTYVSICLSPFCTLNPHHVDHINNIFFMRTDCRTNWLQGWVLSLKAQFTRVTTWQYISVANHLLSLQQLLHKQIQYRNLFGKFLSTSIYIL